ncbi:MAG: peptidoglycan DD-metalloendopeptidase family protein [Acidimicrobiales bacterium]
MRRGVFPVAASLLASLAGVVLTLPATAQEPPPEETTTTTGETTTTTAPGEPTTTTTSEPPTSTTLAPPGPDPGAGGDAPSEPVPGADIVVPPPAGTGPYGDQVPFDTYAGRVVTVDVTRIHAAAEAARQAFAAATAHRQRLEADIAALEAELSEGTERVRRVVNRLAEAEAALQDRAVDAYVFGGVEEHGVPTLLDSASPSDYVRRHVLLEGLLIADQAVIDEYEEAREEANAAQTSRAHLLATTRAAVAQARLSELQAEQLVVATGYELAVTSAGGTVAIHGFVFPVGEPHSFTDSFGAPRMMNTPYAHWHEGTDIFAPAGTPLFAAERGVITRMGDATLGGAVLWLKGESGTSYYYAHLSGYAPGIAEETVVETGTVVGFVGNTGNARTTAPHLHFEVHPDGGAAINPYPILLVADSFEPAAPTAG